MCLCIALVLTHHPLSYNMTDCGNARFAHAGRWGGLTCTLQREREAINTGNQYGHNFEDKWCYCDGPEVLPMVRGRLIVFGVERLAHHTGEGDALASSY